MNKKYTSHNKVLPLSKDIIFKNLVKNKKNIKFLCKLISLYTDLEYNYLLQNIVLKDTDTLEDNSLFHHNMGDVLVEVENNRINIELSMNNKEINKRKNEIMANKYAASNYKIGNRYINYYNFIQICICNYKVFHNNLIVTESNLVDVSSGKYELETKEFKKYHVCLLNIPKSCYTKSTSELTELEKYTMMFTLTDISKLESIVKGDDILEEALNCLKSMSEDDTIISQYEKDEVFDVCYKQALIESENNGISKGINQGISQRNIEIAKKLLLKKTPIDDIMDITELTKEELEKINF